MTVMDPQMAWQDPLAQVPWALQCDDQATSIQVGHGIHGRLVLVGAWPTWATELLGEAFACGLQRGLGAGRIPASLTGWHPHPNQEVPSPGPCPSVLRLSLRTPGRFKDRGQDLSTLHPPAIVRGLIRRWRQLVRQTTGTDPLDGPRAQELSAACDQLVRQAGEDQVVRLERRSNRQDRTHPMDAVGGWCDITGPTLPDLWPWLAMAPWLHVGRQPCFGLGWTELTRNPSCTQDQFDPASLPPSADFSPPVRAD